MCARLHLIQHTTHSLYSGAAPKTTQWQGGKQIKKESTIGTISRQIPAISLLLNLSWVALCLVLYQLMFYNMYILSSVLILPQSCTSILQTKYKIAKGKLNSMPRPSGKQ